MIQSLFLLLDTVSIFTNQKNPFALIINQIVDVEVKYIFQKLTQFQVIKIKIIFII